MVVPGITLRMSSSVMGSSLMEMPEPYSGLLLVNRLLWFKVKQALWPVWNDRLWFPSFIYLFLYHNTCVSTKHVHTYTHATTKTTLVACSTSSSLGPLLVVVNHAIFPSAALALRHGSTPRRVACRLLCPRSFPLDRMLRHWSQPQT